MDWILILVGALSDASLTDPPPRARSSTSSKAI